MLLKEHKKIGCIYHKEVGLAHITETKEGEFNYQANSVFISYRKNLQQINIGANLKIIFDNLDDYSRTGFAADVGIIS
jgi:hypothetical protein